MINREDLIYRLLIPYKEDEKLCLKVTKRLMTMNEAEFMTEYKKTTGIQLTRVINNRYFLNL